MLEINIHSFNKKCFKVSWCHHTFLSIHLKKWISTLHTCKLQDARASWKICLCEEARASWKVWVCEALHFTLSYIFFKMGVYLLYLHSAFSSVGIPSHYNRRTMFICIHTRIVCTCNALTRKWLSLQFVAISTAKILKM